MSRSGRAAVVPQDSTKSVVTLNRSYGATNFLAGIDDRVAQPLMIALAVVMQNELWPH